MRSLSNSLVLAAITLGLTSCGPGNRAVELPTTGASLEGVITYGGEPVQFALVFVRTAAQSSSGKVGPDGRYKINNVPLGEVMIGVNTDAGAGDFQSASMAAGAYKGPESKGRAKVDLKFVKVPAKFHDPATSNLKTTVNAGVNTFDIVIPK